VAERRVTYERDGDVGIVCLDDPPLNLFGPELTQDLAAAIGEAEADAPRALVLRAEGKVFTGGVDVHVFRGLTPAEAAKLFGELVALVHRVEDLPFPTLACVHALCLTAGFELSLGCDLIWAGESAKFGLVERVVGITPAMGGTQRLVERAGPARARELVMSGALYDAATLERWNVVNRVLPDDDLLDAALDFARDLARGPTRAHAVTKRIVRAALDEGIRGADARVGELVGPLFDTEDCKNAVESFLRDGPGKATFEGR
jgi:enoyl-CoA hydratase/carnithine racemase